jgi:hypothetical protein
MAEGDPHRTIIAFAIPRFSGPLGEPTPAPSSCWYGRSDSNRHSTRSERVASCHWATSATLSAPCSLGRCTGNAPVDDRFTAGPRRLLGHTAVIGVPPRSRTAFARVAAEHLTVWLAVHGTGGRFRTHLRGFGDRGVPRTRRQLAGSPGFEPGSFPVNSRTPSPRGLERFPAESSRGETRAQTIP